MSATIDKSDGSISQSEKHGNVILVTIHGVNSDNGGYARLAKKCGASLPDLNIVHANYRSQNPAIVWNNEARKLIVTNIKAKMLEIQKEMRQGGIYPRDARIVIAAHSLGTYALWKYLEQPITGQIIDSVILSGSILPRDIDWSYWVREGFIRNQPVNIVRPFDFVARRGHVYISDKTLSGTRGFIAKGDANRCAINTFKHGGHTSYWNADHEEIISMIKHKNVSDMVVEEDVFMSNLTILQKIDLKFCRALKIC